MTEPTLFLSRTGFRQVRATSVADSINLPGNPTTTTQSPGDNSTRIATTAYTDTAVLANSPAYFIPVGEVVNIPVNRQMANFGEIAIDGVLTIDGQFFTEA